jgi:hypothetical protein
MLIHCLLSPSSPSSVSLNVSSEFNETCVRQTRERESKEFDKLEKARDN